MSVKQRFEVFGSAARAVSCGAKTKKIGGIIVPDARQDRDFCGFRSERVCSAFRRCVFVRKRKIQSTGVKSERLALRPPAWIPQAGVLHGRDSFLSLGLTMLKQGLRPAAVPKTYFLSCTKCVRYAVASPPASDANFGLRPI